MAAPEKRSRHSSKNSSPGSGILPWPTGDQRGAGKTFGRNGPSTPDMTFDRLVDDAIEVAQHVRDRLSQRKVILVGQSAGSLLGVHVIKRRPDLFHAYVGTGQVVSYAASVASQFEWARRQAEAAGDQATLTAPNDAAALPADRRVIAEAGAARKWLTSPSDSPYAKMVRDFMGSAGGDAADWLRAPTSADESSPRPLSPRTSARSAWTCRFRSSSYKDVTTILRAFSRRRPMSKIYERPSKRSSRSTAVTMPASPMRIGFSPPCKNTSVR